MECAGSQILRWRALGCGLRWSLFNPQHGADPAGLAMATGKLREGQRARQRIALLERGQLVGLVADC